MKRFLLALLTLAVTACGNVGQSPEFSNGDIKIIQNYVRSPDLYITMLQSCGDSSGERRVKPTAWVTCRGYYDTTNRALSYARNVDVEGTPEDDIEALKYFLTLWKGRDKEQEQRRF